MVVGRQKRKRIITGMTKSNFEKAGVKFHLMIYVFT
jgi:hypothetical protein